MELRNRKKSWNSKKLAIRDLKETNTFAYVALLILFLGLFFVSLIFDTTEKPFTVFSSIGCGGIASVVVAWLIECSNVRINQNHNKAIVNQLLYGFDTFVGVECQRALRHCAKYQDVDVDKSYTILEIQSMLKNANCDDVYFQGFTEIIKKGLNGMTEVTILNFDQTDYGSKLYDLFLALRTTLQTILQISDMHISNEMVKIMVIDAFGFINDINVLREKNDTYHILDHDKEYIKNFRNALDPQRAKT